MSEDGAYEIHWTVRSDEDGLNITHWTAHVTRAVDEADLGTAECHFVPDAMYNGGTLAALDDYSAGAANAAVAVCDDAGTLDTELVESLDPDNLADGLMIIERWELRTWARGLGLTELLLKDLVKVCQGIALIALEPAPINGPDLTDAEYDHAVERLTALYRRHGLQPAPGDLGVLMATPDMI